MSAALHRCSSLIAALSLACASLVAAESEAPLQETTRELQALKSSKSSLEVSSGQPKTEVPQLLMMQQGPAPTPSPLDARRTEKELSGSKNRSQNWLVDGVAELEKKDQPVSAAKRESDKLDELMPAGRDQGAKEGETPSLLKLYDEQEEKTEAKRELAETAKPMANPLAPFLQNWMGDSPVRGQFFDQFSRGNTAAGAQREAGPVGTAETSPSSEFTSSAPTVGVSGASPREAAPNPYLANLDSGGFRPPVENTIKQTTSVFNPGNFPGSGSPTGLPAPAPVIQAPEVRKKSMPASVTDEQKYFPQLKKF